MTIRVLPYGRVSKASQEISPEVQARHCEEWFHSQQKTDGLPADAVLLPILFDKAVSGSVDLFHRPKGQHILTELQPGDILVVSKASRAFRSPGDAERTMDALAQSGIRLVILDLNIDTATPTGRLFVTLISAVSRFERELICERTKEALDQLKRQGKHLGGVPIGWKRLPRKHNGREAGDIVPDELVRIVAKDAAALIAVDRVSVSDACWVLQKRYGKALLSMSRPSRTAKTKSMLTLSWLIEAAAASILDFPMLPRKTIIENLGTSPYFVDWIQRNYKKVG